MAEFYTTIENQLREDGSYGLLFDHFTGLNQALAKHYSTCSAAAISGIPYHSATVLSSGGRVIRQEIFDRREPETEEGATE